MFPVSNRFFLICSSVGGMLGVVLGAFGAHALKARLDGYYLDIFETGVRYQMYHSLALFSLSLFLHYQGAGLLNSRAFRYAQWLLLLGTLIFSGSLYLLVFLQNKVLGMVTPIGGVLLIMAWACALAGSLKLKNNVRMESH